MGFLFENKRQVWLLVILIILIWLVFPFLFKAFMSWMSWIGADLKTFAEYGPVGDIYGSLNTLFTSATLIIVMYSAYLQREANKDIRESMADQLKQAKDATEEQVEQARESTSQQLALAKATHDAQLKESRYSIFLNGFNSLLNYKHERYLSVQTSKDDKQYFAHEVFTNININLVKYLQSNWKDISIVSKESVEQDFYNVMKEISNINNHTELFTYFTSYIDLYDFINRSKIDEEDKVFYKKIVRNSISTGEHTALIWCGVFRNEIKKLIDNESIIDLEYAEFFMPFAVKFYKPDNFTCSDIKENWSKYT